ncbi:MAG: hypothetical protein MRJ92_13045 [Nitrospira sp.]|nr:hypothetical protein [Nitrospira sp.]
MPTQKSDGPRRTVAAYRTAAAWYLWRAVDAAKRRMPPAVNALTCGTGTNTRSMLWQTRRND